MQIDVGFGDVVHPEPEEQDYPTLLDLPAPRLRMLLARSFGFDGADLARSIQKTFEQRETVLSDDPVALTTTFTTAENTQKQWAAFVKRANLESAPATFDEIR